MHKGRLHGGACGDLTYFGKGCYRTRGESGYADVLYGWSRVHFFGGQILISKAFRKGECKV